MMKTRSHAGLAGIVLAGLLLCLAAGCGAHAKDEAPASRLSEAQRDTAIARSQIPGAAAVGRALDVAGNEATHAAQMDSVSAH
jgi:hypothetical protein